MTLNRTSNKAAKAQHFLPTSLRAAIIASSYWVLSLSLTVVSGSVASFIGCLFACYLIDLGIHRSPLKATTHLHHQSNEPQLSTHGPITRIVSH